MIKHNDPNRRQKTRKITAAGLLLALALVLPQAFHLIGGPAAGQTFLPMHLPVLLAGLILGPIWGLALGLIAPAISFAITGMPGAERVVFMVIELGCYGAMGGLFFHTLGFYKRRFGHLIALVFAMIAGRLLFALSLWVGVWLFSVRLGGPVLAWTATVTGLLGCALQIMLIPLIMMALKKGGQLDGFIGGGKRKTSL